VQTVWNYEQHNPGAWRARTLRRLRRLGIDGFMFGPGVRWWPTRGDEKLAGPFTSTVVFDGWLAAREAGGG
jgi:hypothetical protein